MSDGTAAHADQHDRPAEGAQPDRPDEAVHRRSARERARRRVFGDLLDGSTLDDRPDQEAAASVDRWLQDNVPPHHGG